MDFYFNTVTHIWCLKGCLLHCEQSLTPKPANLLGTLTMILILEIKISLIKINSDLPALGAEVLKKAFNVFILSFTFNSQFSVFTG